MSRFYDKLLEKHLAWFNAMFPSLTTREGAVMSQLFTVPALYAKIHRATVTQADLHYDGSLTVDKTLMDAAGLVEYQKIEVYNITNGERISTYVITGEADSGVIQANGAAAHQIRKGDLVIIAAYADMTLAQLEDWSPNKVFVDANNRIKSDIPALLPV